MKRIATFASVLLLACSDPPVMEGTSVGNPTEMTARIAPSTDVSLSQADFSLAEVTFVYTDRTWDTVAVNQDFDLLAGGTIEFPASEWEAMVLVPGGPMVMSGSTRTSQPATYSLEVDEILLFAREASVRFDDGGHVLELGFPGWLDADFAGYDTNVEVNVDPSSSLVHNNLVTALRDSSTLFGDDDRDGEVGDEERRESGEAGGDFDR
jgi:hypothetical protein